MENDMKNKTITDAYTEMYVEAEHTVEQQKGTALYMESLMHCVEKPSINENGRTSITSVYENMYIESLEEQYESTNHTIEEAYSATLDVEQPAPKQSFMEWHIGSELMEHRSQKK